MEQTSIDGDIPELTAVSGEVIAIDDEGLVGRRAPDSEVLVVAGEAKTTESGILSGVLGYRYGSTSDDSSRCRASCAD